jgi:hypothetical protein
MHYSTAVVEFVIASSSYDEAIQGDTQSLHVTPLVCFAVGRRCTPSSARNDAPSGQSF